MTIAANVVAAGAVVLTAAESAAAGDDLTVNAGIRPSITGSSVTLNAGDNASVGAGALLSAWRRR